MSVVKTVFVVGAGASSEAKLPIGKELKHHIAKLLDIRFDDWGDRLESGDKQILEVLRSVAKQKYNDQRAIQDLIEECHHIRDAMPLAPSIDNFIDNHRDKEDIAICGKLAIIKSILNAEKNSKLWFQKERYDSNINFTDLGNTWYIPFFQTLTENCSKDELAERFKSITFIIFNYDRCVEQFIFWALQNYYRITGEEAGKLVEGMNIYHPYGDVGPLSFGKYEYGKIDFGEELDHSGLLQTSDKIKTFTEGTDPKSSKIVKIRNAIARADRVIFLGFAFHRLNMQLITPEDASAKHAPKHFVTAFNVSDSDTEIIKHHIRMLYSGGRGYVSFEIGKLSCYDFYSEYWRSLSFV